jgi:hypothetical protein
LNQMVLSNLRRRIGSTPINLKDNFGWLKLFKP